MDWDEYFFKVCETVASNSKCLSRKIGAILVKDKTVLSMGYNGPPRNVMHCMDRNLYDPVIVNEIKKREILDKLEKCPRKILGFKSGEGLEYCIAGHAERNTIVNAARHGISVKDSTLYCNCPIPCSPCLIEIINAGIKEIVVTKMEYYDLMGEWLVKESGIKIRKFRVRNINSEGY